jgi:hypothetical protein
MWNKSLTELQFHLANLFPLKEDIIPLAGKAGLPIANLSVSDKGIIFWYNVLNEACHQEKLDDVIAEARRLFPEDEKLASFNSILINNTQEASLDVLKDLCADIIREGQFREAIPLLEEIVARSPSGIELEENLVVRFANIHRHQQDIEELSGRKKTRSLRLLDSSKSEMISLIHAL